MYEHQLDTYSLTLDDGTIENAEACTMRRIKRKKEEIRLLRRAEALDGVYITKRLDEKVKALYPEFQYAYIGSGGHYDDFLYLYLSNGVYINGFQFYIGKKGDRRGSLEMINRQRENAETEVETLTASLAVFRENIAQWNNLMRYAATIYGPIYNVARNSTEYRAEKFCRL